MQTLEGLTLILQEAIAAAGGNTLVINNALVSKVPALGTVLGYLKKTELVISNALLTSQPEYVSVRGQAPTFLDILYNVDLIGTVEAGQERFRLLSRPIPGTNWAFSGNFPALPFYYTTSAETGMDYKPSFFNDLVLSDAEFTVATFTSEATGVSEGLVFSAFMDATAYPFSQFSGYLPANEVAHLPLSGSITMRSGTFPLIDLRAPVHGLNYHVGLEDLQNMYLRLQVMRNLEDDYQGKHPFVTLAQLGGEVHLLGSELATFEVEAPMMQGNKLWAFRSNEKNLPFYLLGGKEQVQVFLGGHPLPLPPAMANYVSFTLEALAFGLNPDDASVEYITTRVGTEPWTTPLPQLKIEKVAVEWTYFFYPSFDSEDDTRLYGTITLGDGENPTHLDIEASVPAFDIEAQMRHGEDISASAAISWLTGFNVNMGTLSITRLNLWAYPDVQEYTSFTEVTGNLPFSIPNMDFDLFNIAIYYTPNSLNAELTLQLMLVGKTFTVRATTPRGSAGWLFSGALMPGQSLSLQELLTALAPGWGTLPSSIGNIAITQLYMSLDTGSQDYFLHVQVEWDYTIVAYAFHIAAQFALQAVQQGNQTAYSGLLRGDFKVNNLLVSTTYLFEPNSQTITFEIAYKQLVLNAELVTTQQGQKTTTQLVVRFPDLTLGEILAYLVQLAMPGSNFALSAPWDLLNQVTLRNLELKIDLQTNEVNVTYPLALDLFFVEIKAISLTYRTNAGRPGVELALSATFFGKEYSEHDPLAWDVLNEPAPTVPAQGPSFLKVYYLGLGQHVSFSGHETLESVTQVLDLMRQEMQPVLDETRNPLALDNGSSMRFDRASHFLIGAQFTLLDTVGLGLIFNDPYLYGLALDLMGPRVGAFAGLHVELLYQRVSNDTGVFKILLQIPDKFRQFEVGAISITLPLVKIDIYTNGNFRLDLGFPAGGNFSNSFSVQLFPFVGYGGLYFGWLNGETATRVPAITNGSFSPVLEFGLGMHIGLGKTISKGPLKGGISIVVEGLLEGTFAWFTPQDKSGAEATYYWLQGALGIVGKLYGSVDFVVIKASINVEASVIVTLVMEAYQTIRIGIRVQVRVSASLSVLFFTVSFSFSLDLHEEFTLGTQSSPPWQLAAPAPPLDTQALARQLASGWQPRLRMQRGLYRRQHARARALLAQAFSQSVAGTHLPVLRAQAGPGLDWTPTAVFDNLQYLGMSLVPSLTIGLPDEAQQGPRSQIVLLLLLENSVATTEGASHEETMQRSARASTAQDAPFNKLLDAMLKWSIHALLGRSSGNVTLADLTLLQERLDAVNAGPSYADLQAFFELNLRFQIGGIPAEREPVKSLGATIFPMFPALSYTGHEPAPIHVDFSTLNPVDAEYELWVQHYYDQLLVNYQVERADDPLKPAAGSPARSSLAPGDDAESMATLILKLYFLMLAQAAVQSALDVLQSYRYNLKAGESLKIIADQFPQVVVDYQVHAGDSVASICDEFGMTVAQLEKLNNKAVRDPLTPGDWLLVEIGVTPQALASSNQHVPLQAGKSLLLTGVLYQVKEDDTLTDIAKTFFQVSPAALLDLPANQQNLFLLNQGASLLLATPDQGQHKHFIYESVADDSLNLLAAFVYARVSILAPETADHLAWYKQTIADFNPGFTLAAGGVIPANKLLLVPGALYNSQKGSGLLYRVHQGDTLDLIARYFLLLQTQSNLLNQLKAGIEAMNIGLDWNNLKPHTSIAIPAQTRMVQPGDTFAALAALFYLDPADLATGPNALNAGLLAPLAVLQIPDVLYQVLTTDTLALVAERFNLTLDELASNVALVTDLFANQEKSVLTITNIPQYAIDKLGKQIVEQGLADQNAGMVARFMTSGLQLPRPDEHLSTFRGLYELTGQQLPCPTVSQQAYTITFTKAPGTAWLDFVASEISRPGTSDSLDATIQALNPGVDLTKPVPEGLYLFTGLLDELTLIIDQKLVQANEPSFVFDPKIQMGPIALPLFEEVLTHYVLQTTFHWQAHALPPFVGDNTPDSQTPLSGEPSIWMFTGELLSLVAESGSGKHTFALSTNRSTGETGTDERKVQRYNWASLIEIQLRQILSTETDGGASADSYEFAGADETARELLRQLFLYLNNPDFPESGTRIYLLFQPNVETNNARGFASEVITSSEIFVLKTNLSTLTSSGPNNTGQSVLPTSDFYSATLAQPAAFLQLLWEGSVTGTGGYTLRYVAGARKTGLPEQIFATSSEGKICLLVLLGSQSDSALANRRLYTFNNCAVVGDNIDPSTQSVFVEANSTGARRFVKLPTVPPGNAGIALSRTNPQNAGSVDAEALTRQLYSLLDYTVVANDYFTASNQSIPLGPSQIHPGNQLAAQVQESDWYYSQVFPLAPFASSALPPCIALPAPANDPYAGIEANSLAQIKLAFHDVYGNVTPSTAGELTVPIKPGYSDDVLDLAQWPGITSTYELFERNGAVWMRLNNALQVANYTPASGHGFEAALRNASAHLDRYSKIYYQIWQEDVDILLTTSLNQSAQKPDERYTLEKVPLGHFVNAAYVFLNAALQQQLALYTVQQQDTLFTIAQSYAQADEDLLRSTIAALADANRELPIGAFFAVEVRMPFFYPCAYGDTLQSVCLQATREQPSVVQLASHNQLVPLNAGVEIAAPLRTTTTSNAYNQIATIAAAMHCSAGKLAQANAHKQNILTVDTVLTVNGVSVTVALLPESEETQSFSELVEAFASAGIGVTPAQIAVANADVPELFQEGKVLDVLDYIIEPGATFASLAALDPQFSIDALAQAASHSPNLFPAGVPLFLQELPPVAVGETTTLALLAQIYGTSIDQLGIFNAGTPLLTGAHIALPDRVEIKTASPLALAPYRVQGSSSLVSIAQSFAEADPLTLAERNRALAYLFIPNQDIAVDGAQTTTESDDSLESVWQRLRQQNPALPFARMIAVIAPATNLLRPDAFLVCHLPSTGAAASSLDNLSGTFNVSQTLLAQVNASLRGFVLPGVNVSLAGLALETLEDETFNSLVQRFLNTYGLQTSVATIAEQNRALTLLNAGQTFLLPPNPVTLEIQLDAQEHMLQQLPATIFPLTTTVIIQRDPLLVAPDFSTMLAVQEGRAIIAPQAMPSETDGTLSLWNFARQTEIALLNRVKLALSGNEETGTRQVWLVNFSQSGISALSLQGDQPNFFAVSPLSTRLLDVANVPISQFNKATGTLEKSQPTNFQGIDLEVWAGIVLPAIELLLSPVYAVPAYRCSANAFARIVSAKGQLATRIAQSVISVLGQMNEGGSLPDARERLRQELLISLTRGYATDVILQYPTKANSPFTGLKEAPRLSGQPVSSVYQSGISDTLATLATYYGVSQVGLVELLGPMVRILKEGAPVSYGGMTRQIAPDDTLNSLLRYFQAPNYQSFVDNLQAPAGLFASRTTINIYRTQVTVEKSTLKLPTLQTLVTYFDAPLEIIVPQNQERWAIFIEGVTISVPEYPSQVVTRENNSLKSMALAIGNISPLALAQAIESQTNILEPHFLVSVVNYVPEFNLSSAKISLSDQPATTTMLLNLKEKSKRKKLLLDLLYNMNELEYDIHTQPGAAGYQASSWLGFIIPIGTDLSRPQVFNVLPGQVEIPLPLRAYPVAPVLLEHTYSATQLHPSELLAAKKWDYFSSYQQQNVPQDTLYLQAIFNIPSGPGSAGEQANQAFLTAMAQFVSVYPDVKEKLTELLVPGQTTNPALKKTIETFADMIEAIEQNWSPISEQAPLTFAPLNSVYKYQVEMTTRSASAQEQVLLNTLTLILQGTPPASPNGQFPAISWRQPGEQWHWLTKSSETAQQCIYHYIEPVRAFVPLEHRLVFPGIDIIDIENANGTIQLKRNQQLVSTQQTAAPFIYQTDLLRFPNLLRPFVRHENLIPFRKGNESLRDALEGLFRTILNNATGGYALKLSAQFGYDLVTSSEAGVDPVVSLLPILFQPTMPYDPGYPERLALALANWQTGKPFQPAQGLYVLDLMIYSARTSLENVPLLELNNLYYDRAPQGQRIVRRLL
ncbi:MAG TPA: LysM peptidoglycan-binding domain-containing protein [Ktedonobacteraceae bacterium]